MKLRRKSYLILMIAFLLSSCSWMQGWVTTSVDTNSLGELFQYREIAMDQGRLLKSKIGATVSESEVRSKYTNVATNFNSTLTVLETSITAGNDPKDYQASLRKSLDSIKAHINELDKYTQENVGSLAGRPIVSDVIVGVVKGVGDIWKNYQDSLKESRAAVTAQLEKQRMPSFEKL
jgi:hypothetical protein